MKKTLIAIALLTTTLTTTAALAKSSKVIKQTIAVEQGRPISLAVPVGSLDIKTCNCHEITVQIKIQASSGSWRFFNDKDMDDASLKVDNTEHQLSLAVEQQDSKQQWTVTLPASSALEIEMGVGEVDLSAFNNSLDVELGVGNVNVQVSKENFAQIKLGSGVGKTALKGFEQQVKNKREMVSSTTKYRGQGEHRINIEVGVGNADIRLD